MNSSSLIVDINSDNYQSVVVDGSFSVPVLVDFWADWCQPCKMLMPLLARLADEYNGQFILAKLDTEANQELAAQFGIRSIPTVKLFKQGQPVDEFMGALPETEIRAFLDRHIPRASDALVAQAETLLASGNTQSALELLERGEAEDPANPRLLLALARLKAGAGEVDAANAILDRLPTDERDSAETAGLRAGLEFARVVQDAPEQSELQSRWDRQESDSREIYQLACHRALAGDYEAALELLLALMRRDRGFDEDAARRSILSIFDILGGTGELVTRYRKAMFNAMH